MASHHHANIGYSFGAPGSRSLGRKVVRLGPVRLVHARGQPVPGESFRKHATHLRVLVRIVDLHAAQPPADPRQWDTLGIARRGMLEGKITRRCWTRVEVLVEPGVGGNDHRSDLPVIAPRLVAL